ncbi:MAG TPA: hypothetical protein VFQ53_33630 [Kofleriaceae bacterium]|nr:hypothetical protein [Kofleriaceae bacterium]
MSFATCTQDTTVGWVDDTSELPGLVAAMHLALVPSIQMWVAGIDHGPTRIKLVAAYHLALAHADLIVRARRSIAATSPTQARVLRDRLEPMLSRSAYIAWVMFSAIGRAAADDPDVPSDVVSRGMIASSRSYAAALAKSFSLGTDDDESVRLAAP